MRRTTVCAQYLLVCGSLLTMACVEAATMTTRMASTCREVLLSSSVADLQSVVDAHPEGTSFCLQPGTYRLAGPVLPKSGNRFIGTPGTVLDGQGTVSRGIWGHGGASGQHDVVVQGLRLVNFTDTAIVMGWGWTVRANEIDHNQIGVSVNSGATLEANHIHDNRQYGIVGGPGRDMLIVDNLVAWNNSSLNCGGACVEDAGGSKIVGSLAGTFNLTWRNNTVRGNVGPGIWSDGNVRAVYEGNTVFDNSGAGILHELSWSAVVRRNTLTNNASESIGRSCWWGANVLINTSVDVEIDGNTIVGTNGSNGICAVSADRAEKAPFPRAVTSFYAHDNTVHLNRSATSGHVHADASIEAAAASDSRFVRNRYRVPDRQGAWWALPAASPVTWTVWRAAEQDMGGTIDVW